MRTGGYTIHQSLTAEAAAVLKLSLSLARRRGHAQVTPLHVAFTLLSSSCSSPLFTFSSSTSPSYHYSLLKRACLKSHPSHSPASHPLHCRALELCFNVALNRLPTTTTTTSTAPHSSPSSSTTSTSSTSFSSSLIQPNPTLSNALIAALKRAQANQRRGCIELQQQNQQPQQQQQQQQQQQPLLAIKVELDQLIISILDDPSVSRVMREAGFSSTTVKSNLEEESAMLLGHHHHHHSSSSPSPPSIPPPFFFESYKDFPIQVSGLWSAQFLKAHTEQNPPAISSHKEDLKVILDVMVRKNGKRSNPVVVGDSVSIAEGVVGELMRRVERGHDVPEELRGAHLVKLQLSYVHLRLMSKGDVEVKVSDLRRSVDVVVASSAGILIYVGDLRWAVDEEQVTREGIVFSPVEHMVAELGRLVCELRNSMKGKVWLLATASYQTYMRCQKKKPSLEALWALQAVVVPTGGLALTLRASASPPSAGAEAKLTQSHFQLVEPMAFASREEEEKLILCAECDKNYEMEASVLKSEAEGRNTALTQFPGWLQQEKPKILPKDNLIELKRKWSRLCRRLHFQSSQIRPYSPLFGPSLSAKNFCYASSHPWWSACFPNGQSKPSVEQHAVSLTETTSRPACGGILRFETLTENGKGKQLSPPQVSLSSLKEHASQDVRTTLALGSLLLSDSATSESMAKRESPDELTPELERRLQENIPWQSSAIGAILEALDSRGNGEKNGIWLFIQGSDRIAKRRAALVIAETHCGSIDKLIRVDAKNLSSGGVLCSEILAEACKKKDQKFVVLIEDIDQAPTYALDSLANASKTGTFRDPFAREFDLSDSIIILTTSDSTSNSKNAGDSPNSVIHLRLWLEEPSSGDLKRKAETRPPSKSKKRPRKRASAGLDLNLCAEEEEDNEGEEEEGHVNNDDGEEEAIPSDITHEGDTSEPDVPHSLLESIATHITLDASNDSCRRASDHVRGKLARSFEEAKGNGGGGGGGGEAPGHLQIDEEVVEELMRAYGSFLDDLFEGWVREVFQIGVATVKKGGKVVRLGLLGSGGLKEDSAVQSGFMGSVLPSRIHVD